MSPPRPFDLSNPAEVRRLIGELRGYMRVSLQDGTDTEGRAHAYAALCALDTEQGFASLMQAVSLPRAHAGG